MLYSMDRKSPTPPTPPTLSGLRERKKQRTRDAIFEAAFRLFAERGYDGVTMAEIAQAAEVAPATVFTHYSSKEDLFYGLRHVMNAALAETVRGRAVEIGVLPAVREWLLTVFEGFVTPESIERSRTFSQLQLETPALLNRSSGFAAERLALLETLIAEQRPDLEPFVVELAAAQVTAGLQTLLRSFNQVLAAGLEPAAVLERARELVGIAFAQIGAGLDAVL